MHRLRLWLSALFATTALAAAGLVLIPVDAQTVILCKGVTTVEVSKCDAGYAAAMSRSHWRMYAGHNCVNYVAWQLGRNGVPEPPILMGNARDWAANAQRIGYRVDSRPAVGSVGAWPGRNHVVYVAEVGSNYLIVREDNYPGYYPKGMYQTLKVYPGSGSYPTQFIHFDDRTSLETPTGLAITKQTASSLSLSWDGVVGAPSYRVQISPHADMSGAKYWGFSSSSGTVTGLADATRYYVRVAVVDSDNVNRLTSYTGGPYPSALTLPAPPTTPINLRSTAQRTDSLTLAWDAVKGAPRYRVQYSRNADMSGSSYRSFTSPSAVLTGLAAATKYYFRVTVVDAADSARLTGYTPAPYPSASTKPVTAALPTPTNLRATSQTKDSLTLAWDAVAGAPRYRIQYSTSPTMSGALYTSFGTNTGTITGLEPDTEYFFRVVVVDANNNAKLSGYTPLPAPSDSTAMAILPIPTGLRSTAQTKDSLTLAWDAVKGAPRYRIQYSKSPTMSGASYRSFTTNSAVLTGLAEGTAYFFRVVVVDAEGIAKLTDYTQAPYPSASTIAAPTTPTNLRSTSQASSSLTLAWNAVPGAPRYRVQYSRYSTMSGASYASFVDSTGVLTGLIPKTTYYFRVVVVDADNNLKLTAYTANPYPFATTQPE